MLGTAGIIRAIHRPVRTISGNRTAQLPRLIRKPAMPHQASAHRPPDAAPSAARTARRHPARPRGTRGLDRGGDRPPCRRPRLRHGAGPGHGRDAGALGDQARGCRSRRSAIAPASRARRRAAACTRSRSSASSRPTTRAATTCARGCCRSATATCRDRRSPCSPSPFSTGSAIRCASLLAGHARRRRDRLPVALDVVAHHVDDAQRRTPAPCLLHVDRARDARAPAAGRTGRVPRARALPSVHRAHAELEGGAAARCCRPSANPASRSRAS